MIVIASQRVARSAPDDRLREAIHAGNAKKDGLLRRFAPRNDEEVQFRDPAA
jgi:hypothetical protein